MSDPTYHAPASRQRRRWAAAAAIVVAAPVASTIALASPAAAAVPGINRVAVTGALNSLSPKGVTATCPAGQRLLGTGAAINGALGEVTLDAVVPNGGPAVAPTAVTLRAYEEDPFAGNWSLTAYAICANPVAGLVRVSTTSAAGSPDFQTVTTVCPAGKRLVGTGAAVSGFGNIVLDDIRPNGSPVLAPNALTVGAFEADPNYVPNWSVTAYAICANANAVPGLVRIANTSPGGVSPDVTGASASCPAGKRATGGGAEANGAFGEVVINSMVPAGIVPTVYRSIGYDADPNYIPNWTMTSYAICATA